MENLQPVGADEVEHIADGVVVWIDVDHQGGALARITTNIAGTMSDSQPDAVTVPEALENAGAIKRRLGLTAVDPIYIILQPDGGNWNPAWGALRPNTSRNRSLVEGELLPLAQ